MFLQFHLHMLSFMWEMWRYPFKELACDSSPRWDTKEDDLACMIQPLEVMQRPHFTGLGYTEGQCSKVSKDANTWLKPLGKENDGNTSPPSYDSEHCKERVEEICFHHDFTRDQQERYNNSWHSNVHFYYKIVANNEHRSWHRKTCSFVDYITMSFLSVGKEWRHACNQIGRAHV